MMGSGIWSAASAESFSVSAHGSWPECHHTQPEKCGPDPVVSAPYKIKGSGIATLEITWTPYIFDSGVWTQYLWNGNWVTDSWSEWYTRYDGSWQEIQRVSEDNGR
jgi:hypothetical protein